MAIQSKNRKWKQKTFSQSNSKISVLGTKATPNSKQWFTTKNEHEPEQF